MITISSYFLSFTPGGADLVYDVTGMRIEKNYVINIQHSDTKSKEYELNQNFKKHLILCLIQVEFGCNITEARANELIRSDNSNIEFVRKNISLQL